MSTCGMLHLQGYYQQLMDKQLIVPGGMIVVDNALMKVLHSRLVCCHNLRCHNVASR